MSTGLLGYYFSRDKQGELLGYSSAMNNIGGIIAMSLSGYLASISWRYSFLVYLIGLFVMLLVIIFLPKAKLNREENIIKLEDIRPNAVLFVSMLLMQVIFYLFITNFAFISQASGIIQTNMVGIAMSVQTVGATILSLMFARVKKYMGNNVRYFGVAALGVSYLILFVSDNLIINSIALFMNGMGFGILMPFLNVTLLGNTPKDKSVGIMSVMSASQYLGQFLSPIILALIISVFSIDTMKFPYLLGLILSIVLFVIVSRIKNMHRK